MRGQDAHATASETPALRLTYPSGIMFRRARVGELWRESSCFF